MLLHQLILTIYQLTKMLVHLALTCLDLAISHFKAFITALRVYVIAFLYSIRELYTDCRENLKFLPKNKLFQSKLKEWRKNSLLLKENARRKTRIYEDEQYRNVEGREEDHALTALVTGAEGTIGSELLDYLLALDFFVIVIGLNPPTLVSERIQFIRCDLSARNEVFEAVEFVSLCSPHIDLLILNAAMMLYPNALFGLFPFRMDLFGQRIIEPHLAINVLANAQLFASLSQRLENSPCPCPRAVFISSCTAHAGDLNLLLKNEESFWCRHLNGYKSYADSKLLLSTYVKYLSRVLKYRHSKIQVASVHPGIVAGKLYRNVFLPIRLFINIVLRPFLRSPMLAATRILDVAFSADDTFQDGGYYENGLVVTNSLPGLEDPENVWAVGTSVRDMIVDSSDESFEFSSSFLAADETNDIE